MMLLIQRMVYVTYEAWSSHGIKILDRSKAEKQRNSL